MIRCGRQEGWLAQPSSELENWAVLNGGSFNGVKCAVAGGDRGSGLLAIRDLKGGDEGPLLVVPRDLVISKEAVEVAAKSDKDLRELLEALGEFVQTTRGAVLTFLLYTATVTAARRSNYQLGSLTPFNQYIKFLPDELLPTFWTPDEVALLDGTSLQAALEAKQRSLEREFALLAEATQDVRWCQDLWWGSSPDASLNLSLDDWKAVDAMYRSRVLEFPGIGDAMVPCIDMANHAAGEAASALYETDGAGNAILLLRDGMDVRHGEEVTITYGDRKGACEMLFSYGFIDESMEDARELFLPLEMDDDDPLARPKDHVATVAPGVKFYKDDETGALKWRSEYVYLMNVNQEDGLEFAFAQTVTGERELQMLFHDTPVGSTADLLSALQKDPQWDVHHLRAVVKLSQLVEQRLNIISSLENGALTERRAKPTVRERCFELALRLRFLEGQLLMQAFVALEQERDELLNDSPVVREYLVKQASGDGSQQQHAELELDEDFT
ncbi:uncharacterized protein PV09_05213 [Verruconis gallopava]|uniref:SET domain-containing protein n=1 Tax=Verruconis gallopava TaxID=253628 RepID=A0A0D2A9M2_9PEZI|nr:uncharacterized protein PV09_05213 [Verruconis gallopava]KIW03443.1 hypothetical protein PV09_05213 [Verruconis gallopava]